MFGKGFFKAGFNGWYQGILEPMVIGRPGKMTLGMARAGMSLGSSRATMTIDKSTATITLGME
jgi:hypothetical protein